MTGWLSLGLTGFALAAADPHSYARPEEAVVRHADLDLAVDFDRRLIVGTTTLRVERPVPSAPLILDTRGLAIRSVSASRDGKAFVPAPFELGPSDAILGSRLTIRPEPGAVLVRVAHASGPQATALQWLTPEQTAGGKFPFLLTQSQSIHARSWIPLQDSPGVRITFSARVAVPWPLGAVMSADGNLGRSIERPAGGAASPGRTRVFDFRLDKPIPPYLLALAVGDLSFRELGPRTGVYAEPAVVERAARELSDVEAFLAAAERLYGEYRWGRYDVLILPPSFGYGGMENPLLTFASPTILAGDKSLVGVLAHELAHSWSGNLVTNATARDFWLNEGFTTYVEGRLIEAVFGAERREMDEVLGRQEFDREAAELPEGDRVLHLELAGRHPDEAVTSVPYVKGALFLRHLEAAFGRERFDRFLRGYLDAHAFRSITTGDFRAYLERELLAQDPQAAKAVPVAEWLTAANIPDGAPVSAAAAFARVEGAVSAWLGAAGSDEELRAASRRWSYHERHHLLRSLPKDLSAERMARLDGVFAFTDSGNAELASEWLQLAVRCGYAPALPRVERFLTSVGREKLIKPIYKELARTPEGAARARAIFERSRPIYLSSVVASIEKVFGLAAQP
ncbi:MAG: M1 family metallopeptidase [Elusimicrobia bacterium]|nr:M1 family metallopeptidase [Elusimicrobiota bacterium]